MVENTFNIVSYLYKKLKNAALHKELKLPGQVAFKTQEINTTFIVPTFLIITFFGTSVWAWVAEAASGFPKEVV